MSSYFDYYCNNIENYGSHDTEQIRGTCYSMCPQDEIRLREKESLVHVLEVVGSERKLIKSYSRSAADSNMTIPQHLRPYNVLRGTLEYLIFEVVRRNDVPLTVVYDFVNDRLRAIRQDMTIQRLAHAECAQLLEPMVRFYVYFGYRLYGLPLRDYDPVLNNKYLLECIKWFLSCCDNIGKFENNGTEDELSNAMDKLQVNGNNELNYDRVLVESLYILCNLNDLHPMFRYLNLPKELKMEPRLQLAYAVALANLKGNFIEISKLLKHLCSLSYCAVCLHLPVMQKQALQVLCHAYNNKRLTVPSSVLRRWLSFASDWEARGVCQHYGLSLDERAVRFDKGDFKPDAPMHTPKIQLLHDGRLNFDIKYIFTYSKN